jgi:Flp pilus assembly protein TadB
VNREHDCDGEESALDRLRGWLSSPTQPETGSTRLRVAADRSGWWVITEPGQDRPLQRVRTREHAVSLATSTLSEGRGGEIAVTEEDGAVRQLLVAKGKRPWWQTSTTPRAGFLLGLLWLGLLVVRLVSGGWPPHGVLAWIMLVVSAVLATWLLVSAALLRRRRRTAGT